MVGTHRIETQQQKQFKRQLLIYSIVFFIIILLFFTFGLRILVNGTVYLTNMFSNTQDNGQTNDRFFGQLEVDSIPEATNSAKIVVAGFATEYKRLDFYLNDNKIDEKNLGNDQSFEVTLGDLNPGENTFYIKAFSSDSKKQTKSTIYTISYKTEKPKLDISDPKDGDKTHNEEITVAGTTNADSYIRVNNQPVVVDTQGKFSTTVRLKEGENKIEVISSDTAGNEEKKTITITYEKDN